MLEFLYSLERRRNLSRQLSLSREQLSHRIWKDYSSGCDRGPISKQGVVWAPISDEWGARLLSILDNSPQVKLSRSDYRAGYMATLDAAAITSLNDINDYRSVNEELMTALGKFLAEYRSQIDQWICHPWRVCSIRQFNLRPSCTPGGKHFDGWPLSIRKAFILPKGATSDTGTTWFHLRDGTELLLQHPGPCIALFENSRVEHALMPGRAARPTIELCITPARVTEAIPIYAGVNGWYPWFPERSVFHHLRALTRAH